MTDPQLHQYLQDLENCAGDDFAMLQDCGAEYFSTSDLLEMRGVWKEKTRVFDKLHRINMFIGLSSPVWLIASGLLFWGGYMRSALTTFTVFPVTFVLFIGFAVFIKIQYGSRGLLDWAGREISDELDKRTEAEKLRKRRKG